MVVEVITPPETEPVSVSEMVDVLRIPAEQDETLIASLITAAREYVERWLQRQLITATLRYTRDAFPTGSQAMLIPRPRLQRITQIRYLDTDGEWQAFDDCTELDNNVWVDARSEPARVRPTYGAVWPSTLAMPNAVEVTYEAGYGDGADDVPMPIRQAIQLLVAHWYEHREAATEAMLREIPFGVMALLRPYAVEIYGAGSWIE